MLKLFRKTALLRSSITLSHETGASTLPNLKILFLSLFWPKNPSKKSKIPSNFLHNLCQIKQGFVCEISKRKLFRGCLRNWIACVRTLVFPLNKRYKLVYLLSSENTSVGYWTTTSQTQSILEFSFPTFINYTATSPLIIKLAR